MKPALACLCVWACDRDFGFIVLYHLLSWHQQQLMVASVQYAFPMFRHLFPTAFLPFYLPFVWLPYRVRAVKTNKNKKNDRTRENERNSRKNTLKRHTFIHFSFSWCDIFPTFSLFSSLFSMSMITTLIHTHTHTAHSGPKQKQQRGSKSSSKKKTSVDHPKNVNQ